MSDLFVTPNGFHEVSQSDFYRQMGPLNVNPSPERSHTRWEMPNRQIVGYSTPGYICQGRKAYYVKGSTP